MSLRDIEAKRKERAARLRASLLSTVRQLGALGALKVILFGSLAAGEIDVTSDVDLLVIMPNTRTSKEWRRTVHERVDPEVATDLLVFSEEDWERELPVSSLLRQIASHGRVVYEKTLP
jgi:predicted nucleotidyltransferase